MHVEVETPEEYAGNIMGDLFPSRDGAGDGRALRQPDHPRRRAAGGDVWLFHHAALDVAGTGNHSMEFHHYAEAPRNVADEIIASRAKSNVPGCDARRLTRATLVPAPCPVRRSRHRAKGKHELGTQCPAALLD